MADAYRRVDKAPETLPANEIRVRRGVGIGRYLKRAWDLLNGAEGGDDTVVIKGVSNAVQSAVNLAELIKHRVKGLHQINKISNITIVDEFEPLIEGLDHLKFSRVVTMLQITLTKSENVDTSDIGYQPPIPESEVQEYNERERNDGEGSKRGPSTGNRGRGERGRGRGRGRGGRGRGLRAGFRGRGGDGGDRYPRDRRDDGEERKEGTRGGARRGGERGYDDGYRPRGRGGEPRRERDDRDDREDRPRERREGDRPPRGDRGGRGQRRDYGGADYDGERPRRGGPRGGPRGERGGRGRGGERGGRGGAPAETKGAPAKE